MPENSGKGQGPRSGGPPQGQNAGPGPAGPGANRPPAKEAPKLETEEWVFTVAKETGALVKIERVDAGSGKRDEVTLEEFGKEFAQRANNTVKTMYERQMGQGQQGNPYGYW